MEIKATPKTEYTFNFKAGDLTLTLIQSATSEKEAAEALAGKLQLAIDQLKEVK